MYVIFGAIQSKDRCPQSNRFSAQEIMDDGFYLCGEKRKAILS